LHAGSALFRSMNVSTASPRRSVGDCVRCPGATRPGKRGRILDVDPQQLPSPIHVWSQPSKHPQLVPGNPALVVKSGDKLPASAPGPRIQIKVANVVENLVPGLSAANTSANPQLVVV